MEIPTKLWLPPASDSVRAPVEYLPPLTLPAQSPSLWVCLSVTSSSQKTLKKPQKPRRSHDAASVCYPPQQTRQFAEKQLTEHWWWCRWTSLFIQPEHQAGCVRVCVQTRILFIQPGCCCLLWELKSSVSTLLFLPFKSLWLIFPLDQKHLVGKLSVTRLLLWVITHTALISRGT